MRAHQHLRVYIIYILYDNDDRRPNQIDHKTQPDDERRRSEMYEIQKDISALCQTLMVMGELRECLKCEYEGRHWTTR